jgi:phosphomannomutase/phosphoglucomutase
MSIYKACDIRGVYPSQLDEPLSCNIGSALGTLLKAEPIIVAGDVRTSTGSLKTALIEGLMGAGCAVTDIGTVPTPAFYYALRKLGIPSGVMVTASHNPARYNGFKIAPFGLPITLDLMDLLKSTVESGRFETGKDGSLAASEIIEDYEDYIIKTIGDLFKRSGSKAKGDKAPLRLVVDCGNGCYSKIAPEVLRKVGFDVVELFCWEDGSFPNREPNPAVAANLEALSKMVISENAQLGIAFDGDGDRVVFADGTGAIIPSDNVIALFAQHLLAIYHGGKVVFDIKCSSLVRDTVKASGGVPVMEKSGHAYIKTNLLENKAIFAGEISGHFFFEALKGDDGLFAALLMAKLLTVSDQSLNELIDRQPKYFITKDLRIPYSSDPASLLNEIRENLSKQTDCDLVLLDGVRAEYPEGWGLIRASVTEPLVTLRFEGKSPEGLLKVKERFISSSPVLTELVNAIWQKYLP